MAFNYDKLRGRIKEKFGTQKAFATALGIGYVSLSQRLNNTLDFSNAETVKACRLLEIPENEISAYFFTPEVQKSEQ